MKRLDLLLSALTLLTLAACSDSSGDSSGTGGSSSGGSGGSGGAGEACPLVSLVCDGSCGTIDGLILERGGTCTSRTVRLGCWPADATQTDDMACIKDANNGDLFQLSSGSHATALAETDDFEACTEAEAATAMSATQCDHTIGADGGACPLSRDGCPEDCQPFNGQVYDGENQCLEAETQLGCVPVGATITKNGSCAEEVATGSVWLVTSGTYSQALLVSGLFVACGLDDTAGATGSPPACP